MFNIFKNEGKAKDPVCGMSVDKEKTSFSTEYNEKKYYFCSESCLSQFKEDPKSFED